MSLIDFQIRTDVFLDLLRYTLLTQKLCPPGPWTFGPVTLAVDHVDFGASQIRHNVPSLFTVAYMDHGDLVGVNAEGFKTQIAQTVTVFVTTLNDVLLHPNQAPAIILAFPFTVVLEVLFWAANEDCIVEVRFASLEPGLPPALPPNFDPRNIPFPVSLDSLLAKLNDAVRDMLPSPSFALKKLIGLLPGGNTALINAGVSVDGQGQFLDFRVQLGGSTSYIATPWTNFFKGFIEDRILDKDWGLFIDQGYLESTLQNEVADAIGAFKPGKFRTFVGASYTAADPGTARLTVNVEALYDLPDPLPTVSFNPHIPIDITVPAENQLQVDIYLPDLKEAAETLAGPLEAILPVFLGPLGAWISGFIESAISDIKDPDLGPACKRFSPDKIRCLKSLPVPSIASGVTMRLTSLLALDGGVTLAGALRFQRLAPAVLTFGVHEFKWRPPKITCGSASIALVAAFGASAGGFRILHGDAFIDNAGAAPVFLCGATIVNDPRGAFPQSAVSPDGGVAPLAMSIDLAIPPDAYYANPYPCDLLVKTTAGLRLLRLHAPPKVTQDDLNRLQAELLVEIGNCEQLIDPWFNEHRGFNPKWGVDGPDSVGRHIWEVEVTGLRTGESYALADSSGHRIAEGIARGAAALTLTALVLPAVQSQEMSIQRTGDDIGDTSPGPPRGIEVRQHLLMDTGEIELPDVASRIHGAVLDGKRMLLAIMPDAVAAWDFSTPDRPLPATVWRVPGVRGLVPWRGGVLLYGDSGFQIPGQQASGCCHDEIADAAAGSQVLYALTPAGLAVYSSGLCKIGQAPLDRSGINQASAESLLVVGDKLVVGGANLAVYDISAPARPALVMSRDGVRVRGLRPNGSGAFIALLEDGSAVSFPTTGTDLEPQATYTQPPWFADSVVMGESFVGLEAGGRTLRVSKLGGSAAF